MIEFINVIAEGLGSIIHRTEYKLNHKGITIITGKNGAGKTTIFNVLSWVLYKKLLKNGSSLEPWDHLKPKDFKGSYGEVNFIKNGITYSIIRVQDYKEKVFNKKRKNSLIIIENGQELPLRDKEDNQTKLIEILGYSFDLFKSTILFGQELKRMMGEDGATKKKILEETFDASFINKAKELVIKENTPLREEQFKLEREINAQRQILSNLRELVKNIKNQRKTYKEKKHLEIAELKKEKRKILSNKFPLPKFDDEKLKAHTTECEDLKTKLDQTLSNKEFKLNLELHTKTDELEKAQKIADSLKEKFTKDSQKCSQCGNELNENQKKEIVAQLRKEYTELKTKIFHLEIEAKNIKKEYEIIQTKVSENDKVYDRITELKTIIQKYKQQKDEYDFTLLKVKETLNKVERIKEKIKDLKTQKFSLSTKDIIPKLKAAKEKIAVSKNDLKFLRKKISINEWLINDPLSNSGLKAMIFDTMLAKINQKLKLYTKDVGFNINIFIDLKSSHKNIEIAVLMKGNYVLYNDLSGGQKQLVDIVLAFANDDVVFENKPINILLLDEVFESLSSDNLEIISNIIQQKSINRCIHLITHQNTFSPLTSRKVFVELNKDAVTEYTY